MKILFCTNAFETVSNGPAKFAQLLLSINTLYPQHEIRILTEDVTASTKNVYKQTVSIHRALRPFGMFIRMFLYHNTAMKLHKTEFPFDVLVYNNAIIGLRSSFTFRNTIGFINDDNNASAKWKSAFTGMRWNKSHVFFWIEWLATRTSKRIVANSIYLKKYLTDKYGISNNKIVHLYKAIEFEPISIERNNSIPHILFVKNDYIRGGLFTLIEALKALNIPVSLTIAGPPPAAESAINTKITGSKIVCNFEGIISQTRVYELMLKADIFCVPSFKEGLGVANIEAMALGCNVITSNAGGIPEVLDNGNNGWMVNPGDVTALKYAISDCLGNRELSNQKKRNAQAFIAKFKLTVILDSFINNVLNFEK